MPSTDINGTAILILSREEAKNLYDALACPLDTDTIALFKKVENFLKETL